MKEFGTNFLGVKKQKYNPFRDQIEQYEVRSNRNITMAGGYIC